MDRNFQLMFCDCLHRYEFLSRTRCSQVAILSLSSPNRVDTGQAGRLKFGIKEETLVKLHSLGFSWEDISRMLLVSCWTIHRRVSEFGLTHLFRFSDTTDEQLDSKVSAFLNEHGCKYKRSSFNKSTVIVNLDQHNRSLSSIKKTLSPLCYLLFLMRLNLTELMPCKEDL